MRPRLASYGRVLALSTALCLLSGAAACGGAPPQAPEPSPAPEASLIAASPPAAPTPDVSPPGRGAQPAPAPVATEDAPPLTAPPYEIRLRSAVRGQPFPGFAETPDGLTIVGAPAWLPTPLLGATVVVEIVRIDPATGARTTVARFRPVTSSAAWGDWSVPVPPNARFWADGLFEIVATATLGSESYVHTRRLTVDATLPAVTYRVPELILDMEVSIAPETEHRDIVSYVTWEPDSLPEGLTLDRATGVISGTPQALERAQTLPIEVRDDINNVYRTEVSFPPVRLARLPTREDLGIREFAADDAEAAAWSAPARYEAGAAAPWRHWSMMLLDVETGTAEAWAGGGDPGPDDDAPDAVSPGHRFLNWPGRLYDREAGRWYVWDEGELRLDRTWGSGSGERLLFHVERTGDDILMDAALEPLARVAIPPGERFSSAAGGYVLVRECAGCGPGDRFHIVNLDDEDTPRTSTWTLPWKTVRDRRGAIPYDIQLRRDVVAVVADAGPGTCRVVRYDLGGSLLSDVEIACQHDWYWRGPSARVSPDGRMIVSEAVPWVAGSWDVILQVSDATTGEAILRVKSIWPGRHGADRNGGWKEIHLDDIWLADGSGIVVATPSGPRIVTLDGTWEWAPGRPSTVDAGLFYSVFDAPPAVMGRDGEVLASVSFGPDGPPLGEYPLTGPYRGCYLGTRADWGAGGGTVRIRRLGRCAPEGPEIVVGWSGPPLAPVIERPPFDDRLLVEVAVDTCLRVREDHSVDARVVACLPDGTVAETDDVIRAWMHIRTEGGVEGWAHADYLRWHSDGVRLEEPAPADVPADPDPAALPAAPAVGVVGDAVAGELVVELRIWQHVDNARDTWVSARPRGGRWDALGTLRFPLDAHGFSSEVQSFHWFRDLAIAGTELRVWQRHRAPELIYVRACVTRCANWLKPFTQTDPRTAREVAEAWPEGVYGWHPLGMVPLPLDDGHSASGLYRYGDLSVAVPVGNPGLASDREHLLALRDALSGTATLDWSAGTPTSEWTGVRVGGSPARVIGLDLTDRGLDGEIRGWLGDLAELTELRLEGNRLTGTVPSKLATLTNLAHVDLAGNELEGCVPPSLRAAARHDLALAGLPDCGAPILLERSGAFIDSLHDGSTAATYRWSRFSGSSVFDLPRGLEFRIAELGWSGVELAFEDCPPCYESVLDFAESDLDIWHQDSGGWLLLSPVTGEAWARSHYEEDDPRAYAVIEQIAASVWVRPPGGDEGEWTWP